MTRAFTVVICACICLTLGTQIHAQFIFGTPRIPSDGHTTGGYTIDDLEMYFELGTGDIGVRRRESVDQRFGASEKLGESVNSRFSENTPSLSRDGLSLYFMSSRPGGFGSADLYVSHRASAASEWSPAVNLGEVVNSRRQEGHPVLSANGLELYFSGSYDAASRDGGFGHSDIWVSERNSVDDPFREPVNLGELVNTGHFDGEPTISSDGLALFYGSARSGGSGSHDLWVTTRKALSDPWRAPVNLGARVNSGNAEITPSLSPDDSKLYFRYSSGGVREVAIIPFESFALSGAGGTYEQNFDEALGIDGATIGTLLPAGWTSSDNGVVFENATTRRFPELSLPTKGTPLFNAGTDQDTDRTLAIGATRDSEGGVLQLLANVVESDAATLRLSFDIEAWDATTSSRNIDNPGEAAFNLTVETDTGNGFTGLFDFGTATTGPTLQPPDQDFLDGNAAASRVSFDSGIQQADIPAGSELRFRWTIPQESQTMGWVSGLDNVQLSLTSGVLIGDFNGNGTLDAGDLDRLNRQVLAGTLDLQFDLDRSETVDADDRQVWVKDLANTWFGDADLNGEFNSADLVALFTAGEYEDSTPLNSTWATGDWNGDGDFGTGDLVLAFQDGGYEQGPRAAVNAVPEPASVLMLLTGLTGLAILRRRHVA